MAMLWPSNRPKEHRKQHSICVIMKSVTPVDPLHDREGLEAAVAAARNHTQTYRGSRWDGDDDTMLLPIRKDGEQYQVLWKDGLAEPFSLNVYMHEISFDI